MKNDSLITLLAVALLSASATAYAEAPAGYYSNAEGKSGSTLLEALYDIIGEHTALSYSGLWDAYKTTDMYPGTNRIWDMYSTAEFRAGDDQCGNYSREGDCYNREHSMPKSWFFDQTPMYTDLFHVYPTDGYVNNRRGNFPFGETDRPTYTSNDGFSKLGPSSTPGYTGTVFEPNDEYKGDFARSYFYMAACYNDRIDDWESPMLSGDEYPCFTQWAIDLLLKWNEQDPVDDKETERNDAVESLQHNRNPFIDHQELAEYIWGDRIGEPWHPSAAADPIITSPVDGETIDLGITASGRSISQTIEVKAMNLSKDLTVTVSDGTGFSVSPATVTADAANSGEATITVTFRSTNPTDATGTLRIASSETASTFPLHAVAVDGIPAQQASDITADAFTAHWIDINQDGSNYLLSVYYEDGKTLLGGYPVNVEAATQNYRVTGLEYAQTYCYCLTDGNGGSRSNMITVTTLSPDREIWADIPAGGLSFSAKPGEASQPLTVTVYSQFVPENTINVTITDGFEISETRTDWHTSLDINTRDTEETGAPVYVRMTAREAGEYHGVLSASTPTVQGLETDVTGIVTETFTFIEDFEAASSLTGYEGGTYTGTACRWNLENSGIYGRTQDHFDGKQAVCTGKSGSRSITMLDDKRNGAGTIRFMAAPFNNDESATVEILYSTDSGRQWTSLQTFDIRQSQSLQEYSAKVDISENIRFRIKENDGERVNIDNIAISDFSTSAVTPVEQGSSPAWDAYFDGTQVRITVSEPADIHIYKADARLVYARTIESTTMVSLPSGAYIVVNGNDSRTIIVR